MKVYAIKRDDGKYLKVTIDRYNDFNEEEFVNDLYEATLYASYDLEYAEYKCEDLRDCKIVECELMEANELADHDKKVRAEVVAEIRDIAGNYWNLFKVGSINGASFEDFYLTMEDFDEILDCVLENSENSQKSSTGGEE